MKAFVLSILTSLVFLTCIGLLFHSEKRETRTYVYPQTVIKDCPKAEPVKQSDPNDKFRYLDVNFPPGDFKNRSYGQYRFSWGETIDLKIANGEYEYDFGPKGPRGWFFIKDILFTDVTGDGLADAIIWVTHVNCGVSCDGGRALFFIYTGRRDTWREVWRYETGSYGYGCGFKSLTVLNKQLVLQMFGRCERPEAVNSDAERFVASYTTISQFRYSGSRFVQRESELISVPKRDVQTFEAEIHIIE